MRNVIVGVSGASGMPLAMTVLQALRAMEEVRVHLIVSPAAGSVLETECKSTPEVLYALADTVYDSGDIGAAPASGSWPHDGMMICPCSMATLAAVATGVGSNLLHRAADVCLKERRPLVLVTRETPLSRIHLRNMLTAAEAGAQIMPFCPGFYGTPESVQDILEHMAGRILDQFAIPHHLGHRWKM